MNYKDKRKLWQIAGERIKNEITDPDALELLRKVFGYFEYCDKQQEKRVYPYTQCGLAAHVGVNDWRAYKNKHKRSADFVSVFNYAEREITCEQLTGALVGIYGGAILASLYRRYPDGTTNHRASGIT